MEGQRALETAEKAIVGMDDTRAWQLIILPTHPFSARWAVLARSSTRRDSLTFLQKNGDHTLCPIGGPMNIAG